MKISQVLKNIKISQIIKKHQNITNSNKHLNITNHLIFIHILFKHKTRDNTNKKITIYYVVLTRLTRVGCFNWLAHYKRTNENCR